MTVALELMKGKAADADDVCFFTAQILQQPLKLGQRHLITREQDELLIDIAHHVARLFCASKLPEPAARDTNLNPRQRRPLTLAEHPVARFTALLELLHLLLNKNSSRPSASIFAQPRHRSALELDRKIEATILDANVQLVLHQVISNTLESRRRGRVAKLLASLFYNFCAGEERLREVAEPFAEPLADMLAPAADDWRHDGSLFKLVSSDREAEVRAAALCFANLAFHDEATQRLLRDQHTIHTHANHVLLRLKAANMKTLFALFKAYVNTTRHYCDDIDDQKDIKRMVQHIAAQCGPCADYIELGALATTALWSLRKDSLAELVRVYSEHVFERIADEGRKSIRKRHSMKELWPMAYADSKADQVAAHMFVAMSVTKDALDAWTRRYWLGEEDCVDIPSPLVDRLCMCGLDPEHVRDMCLDDEARPEAGDATDILRLVMRELQGVELPDAGKAKFFDGNQNLGYGIKRAFWEWNEEHEQQHQRQPTPDEIEAWFAAYVRVMLELEHGDRGHSNVQQAVDGAVESPGEPQRLQFSPCSSAEQPSMHEVVVLAFPGARDATYEELVADALRRDGAVRPREGMKRWYHSCQGQFALDVLHFGRIDATMSSSQYSHDLGAGKSLYLYEQFKFAADHRSARVHPCNAVAYPANARAILVFETPESELLDFDEHLVLKSDSTDGGAGFGHAKACMFACRNKHELARELRSKQDHPKLLQLHDSIQTAITHISTAPPKSCSRARDAMRQLQHSIEACTRRLDTFRWVFGPMVRTGARAGVDDIKLWVERPQWNTKKRVANNNSSNTAPAKDNNNSGSGNDDDDDGDDDDGDDDDDDGAFISKVQVDEFVLKAQETVQANFLIHEQTVLYVSIECLIFCIK